MAYQQPWLHDLTVALSAPTAVLSGGDGQIRPGGVQGVLHADLRVLGRAELRVDGVEPVAVAGGLEPGSAAAARFTALARGLGDGGADPTVRVERLRRVGRGRVDEEIRIVSFASAPVDTEAVLALSADLSAIELVKSGRAAASVAIDVHEDEPLLRWGSADAVVSVRAEGGGARVVTTGGGAAELRWPVRLPPRGSCTLRWSLAAEVRGAPIDAAPDASAHWSNVSVACDDRRLSALADRSFADLRALLLTPADRPGDVFAAAGAPWFFTLFGRDSIWTARLLLPFGWELAAGTLRALAERQGTKNDPETMEAPGRIPHELRRSAALHAQTAADGAPMALPPLYYGTADATPLWAGRRGRGPTARRWPCRRSTTAPWTPRRCGSACCTTPGGPACPRIRSGPCCRSCAPRCAGWCATATRTATASSSTSTAAAADCRTRAGRTPSTRSASATARWPADRWRCAKPRATRTRRPSPAPPCSTRSPTTRPARAVRPAGAAGSAGPAGPARSARTARAAGPAGPARSVQAARAARAARSVRPN